MSTNGHYDVDILPENVYKFVSNEHYLIFEIDDEKYKRR